MLSSAGSQPAIAKAQLALHKDPAGAIETAEQILNSDPNNSGAHRIVAEAAIKLEMPQTAVMSLEVLSRNSPRDREVAIRFANALAEIGEAQRAENLLSELLSANPGDNELAQALKNLSARKTLDEGGYENLADGQGSYRDILKDKAEAVSLEQQNRQVITEDTASRLIQEYEGRLQTEPGNLRLLRNLAELYTEKKQFDKALEYYQRIKRSDMGGDAGLDRAISDLVQRRYDHQIANLDPNSPDHDEEVARLQAEKEAYSLSEAQKRVERFPTDLQLRFELGQAYFEQGKIGEAIAEFQRAQANPHRRIAALNYLAQCFARRKMNDLAARTLQTAIKEKVVFDDEKKELVYNLGTVLDAMGKRDEAVEQFKLIYEMDIGYKDVAARVDAYYASQSG
jgi:tetratricopeptide (TPR) repeat protein